MPYEALTKPRITGALRRLGELAHARKLTLELSLYGGAVFTRPSAVAKELAALVATEQGLPEDWLNESVKQFLAPKEEKRRLAGHEFGPGLRVSVPTAAYLLALKLRACRPPLPGYPGDEGDIRFLLRKIRPKSLVAVEAIFEKFFPGDALSERATALVEETLEELKR